MRTTFFAGLVLGLSMVPLAFAQPDDAAIIAAAENVIVLPEPIDDPIEPINRGLWEVNKGLMIGVIKPTSKAYRLVVPAPLRDGIRNAGQNLGYPKRVVNNLLQEKWIGARDETYRFFFNSVFGIGGLFDVGTRWGVAPWETDSGQTLGTWGWKPHFYLMLPIAGPSNDRDAVGSLVDNFLNPLTYFPPYSYISYGITYNNLSDTVDDYVRRTKTDFDPYSILRYAWTIKRESRDVDLSLQGEQDEGSLETLQSVFFTFKDPKFPQRGRNFGVYLPDIGHTLPFTAWLQETNAPLVYVIPGLGSHRLNDGALALAELLHLNGCSVVTVSSTFNHEFMEHGSSVAMPGYTPVDARDMHLALTGMDQLLSQKYPQRFGSRALMGYSMGGFHALHLAATEATNESRLRFDRYVAIDAPVRLDYAISQLDESFRAALDWPVPFRTRNIQRTFLKVAALQAKMDSITPETVIPLNAVESKFLIGLAFRLSLRDVIFLSQVHTNQGVLANPIDQWRREPVYHEILQLSFEDYLRKFVGPYYEARGISLENPEVFREAVDLRAYSQALKANPKIRIIENANDFLLGEDGLAWTRQTFPPERLKIFERGGHLGNLAHPLVQQSILETVTDLK